MNEKKRLRRPSSKGTAAGVRQEAEETGSLVWAVRPGAAPTWYADWDEPPDPMIESSYRTTPEVAALPTGGCSNPLGCLVRCSDCEHRDEDAGIESEPHGPVQSRRKYGLSVLTSRPSRSS